MVPSRHCWSNNESPRKMKNPLSCPENLEFDVCVDAYKCVDERWVSLLQECGLENDLTALRQQGAHMWLAPPGRHAGKAEREPFSMHVCKIRAVRLAVL